MGGKQERIGRRKFLGTAALGLGALTTAGAMGDLLLGIERLDNASRRLDQTDPIVNPQQLSEARNEITVFEATARQQVESGNTTIAVPNPEQLRQAYRLDAKGTAREKAEQEINKTEGVRSRVDAVIAMGGTVVGLCGFALRSSSNPQKP